MSDTHPLDPVNIARRGLSVDGAREDWRYHGFWNESHNTPSEPVLITGDASKFEQDKRRMRARAKARHDKMCRNKFILYRRSEWHGE